MPIHSNKKLSNFPDCLAENVKLASNKRIIANKHITENICQHQRNSKSMVSDPIKHKKEYPANSSKRISNDRKPNEKNKSYLKSNVNRTCIQSKNDGAQTQNKQVLDKSVQTCSSADNQLDKASKVSVSSVNKTRTKKRLSSANYDKTDSMKPPSINKKSNWTAKPDPIISEDLKIDLPSDINDHMSPAIKKVTPRLQTSDREPTGSVLSSRSTYRSAMSLDVVDLWDSDHETDDILDKKINQSFDFADLNKSVDVCLIKMNKHPNIKKIDSNAFLLTKPKKTPLKTANTYIISQLDLINDAKTLKQNRIHNNHPDTKYYIKQCQNSKVDSHINSQKGFLNESDYDFDISTSYESQAMDLRQRTSKTAKRRSKNANSHTKDKKAIWDLQIISLDSSDDDNQDVIIGKNSKLQTNKESSFEYFKKLEDNPLKDNLIEENDCSSSSEFDSAIDTDYNITNESEILADKLNLFICPNEPNEDRKVTFNNFVAVDDGHEKSFDVLRSANNSTVLPKEKHSIRTTNCF